MFTNARVMSAASRGANGAPPVSLFALILAFAALRWLGVSRGGSLAGGLSLLFAGVFAVLLLARVPGWLRAARRAGEGAR